MDPSARSSTAPATKSERPNPPAGTSLWSTSTLQIWPTLVENLFQWSWWWRGRGRSCSSQWTDVFPPAIHSKLLRCSKYRILSYTPVSIGSEDSCTAEFQWPSSWAILRRRAPWQTQSPWPWPTRDGWLYFPVWDPCMITLNTDAWSLFRTLAGMRGKCLSNSAARPARPVEYAARSAELSKPLRFLGCRGSSTPWLCSNCWQFGRRRALPRYFNASAHDGWPSPGAPHPPCMGCLELP